MTRRSRQCNAADRPRDEDVRHFAADASLILAGGRAILLQIADPVVAAGVARHSDFARRPQQRLIHTLMYIYAVVLGDAKESAAAAAFVDHAHVPVAGASDADRQLWVAATLYDSAIRMHTVLRGPVSERLRTEVLAAYEPLGTALQLPPDAWPSTLDAFSSYWERAIGTLTVTEDARSVVRDLFFPRLAPWWVRAAMRPMRILTVGLLPLEVRSAYGFAWGRSEQERFARICALLRIGTALVPGAARRMPARWLLHALHTGSTARR